MMKKVYICSPLGGDVAGNLQRAKQYAKYALLVRNGSGRSAFLRPMLE